MKSAYRVIACAVLATSMLSNVAAAQAVPGARPAAASHAVSPERMDRVRQVLQSYVDQGRIAGAVVQVRQDGRDVLSAAVGWRARALLTSPKPAAQSAASRRPAAALTASQATMVRRVPRRLTIGAGANCPRNASITPS